MRQISQAKQEQEVAVAKTLREIGFVKVTGAEVSDAYYRTSRIGEGLLSAERGKIYASFNGDFMFLVLPSGEVWVSCGMRHLDTKAQHARRLILKAIMP
jgi:hypothetical protein